MQDQTAALRAIIGNGVVSYHAIFARALGSVTAGIFLSQAYFWQYNAKYKDIAHFECHEGKDFFQKTGAEIYEATALTDEQQLTARRILVKAGILTEKRAGIPAKNYYHIDVNALVSVIDGYLNPSVKLAEPVSANNGTQFPGNTETGVRELRKQSSVNAGNSYIESLESIDSYLREEKEKSAQGAEFAPVKDEVVRNESEAPARPPQAAEFPHTVNGVTYDTDNPIPQHTVANTQDPARFIATAVNDAVQWVEQNADLVTDWFLMAKKPRPTETAAQLAERLRPSIAEFFSYYLQNSEHKVRRKPGDFFQTSFIRWMQSDLFEKRQQPAVSNNQYGRNTAQDRQSTPGKEVSPYKNLSWF